MAQGMLLAPLQLRGGFACHSLLRWEAIELQTMTPDRSAKGAVARKQADVLLMRMCTMTIRAWPALRTCF